MSIFHLCDKFCFCILSYSVIIVFPSYQAVQSLGAFRWVFHYLFGCLLLLGHLAKTRGVGNIVMACCLVLFLVESLPFICVFC